MLSLILLQLMQNRIATEYGEPLPYGFSSDQAGASELVPPGWRFSKQPRQIVQRRFGLLPTARSDTVERAEFT